MSSRLKKSRKSLSKNKFTPTSLFENVIKKSNIQDTLKTRPRQLRKVYNNPNEKEIVNTQDNELPSPSTHKTPRTIMESLISGQNVLPTAKPVASRKRRRKSSSVNEIADPVQTPIQNSQSDFATKRQRRKSTDIKKLLQPVKNFENFSEELSEKIKSLNKAKNLSSSSNSMLEPIRESNNNESVEVVSEVKEDSPVELKTIDYASNENDDVGEDVHENDDVGDDVHENDDVSDNVYESDDVGDDVHESGDVGDDVLESGDVDDDVHESGDVDDDIHESGDVDDDIHERDDVDDGVHKTGDVRGGGVEDDVDVYEAVTKASETNHSPINIHNQHNSNYNREFSTSPVAYLNNEETAVTTNSDEESPKSAVGTPQRGIASKNDSPANLTGTKTLQSREVSDVISPSEKDNLSEVDPLHLNESFGLNDYNGSERHGDGGNVGGSSKHIESQPPQSELPSHDTVGQQGLVNDSVEELEPHDASAGVRNVNEVLMEKQRKTFTKPPSLSRPTVLVRKRKERVKSTSENNFLSHAQMKGMLEHYSGMRLTKSAVVEADKVFSTYFKRLCRDMEAVADHGGRKVVDRSCLELIMKRQKVVNKNRPLHVLIEEMLPMEYREKLLSCAKPASS